MLGGGLPAWLLAVRRLQLDSATAARLVSGITVVLAGSIALQGVYARSESDRPPGGDARVLASYYATSVAEAQKFAAAIHALPDQSTVPVRLHSNIRDTEGDAASILIGTCADLRSAANLTNCVDGEVYAPTANHPTPSAQVRFGDTPSSSLHNGRSQPSTPEVRTRPRCW